MHLGGNRCWESLSFEYFRCWSWRCWNCLSQEYRKWIFDAPSWQQWTKITGWRDSEWWSIIRPIWKQSEPIPIIYSSKRRDSHFRLFPLCLQSLWLWKLSRLGYRSFIWPWFVHQQMPFLFVTLSVHQAHVWFKNVLVCKPYKTLPILQWSPTSIPRKYI